MKIAIPVNPDLQMSPHFGRCHAFLVVEVVEGLILSRELRSNEQGDAGHDHHPANQHGLDHHRHDHHRHDHHRFVQLLAGCAAVVGAGMGSGARRALESAGLAVRLVDGGFTPDEAALRFAAGQLNPTVASCCGGSACARD